MTAKYEVTKQSQDNSDHNDACSPFCICSCCAGFSINHTLTSFSFVIERPTRSYSEAITAKTNSLSLPVWQPPQLTA